MQIDPNPGMRSLAAALSCVVAVGCSVAFLDRSVSTYMHQTFHGVRAFVMLTHIVDPILPGSALGLIAAAAAVMSGWRPGRFGRGFIACCMAALLAYALKDQAKFAFGRLWPETWVNGNPSWIGNGAYGFTPFHGGAGWGSFPSGHMTGITAPLSVVWIRAPRWRWLVVILILLVAVGLLGADFHFLGDIIAGIYLGAACGTGVLAALHAGWTEDAEESSSRSSRSNNCRFEVSGALLPPDDFTSARPVSLRPAGRKPRLRTDKTDRAGSPRPGEIARPAALSRHRAGRAWLAAERSSPGPMRTLEG